MSEESADLISNFRRENMFEFAGLLLDLFLIFNMQSLDEEPLGEAVSADDVLCALASALGKVQAEFAVVGDAAMRLDLVMAAVWDGCVRMRLLFTMRAPRDQSHLLHVLDGHGHWQCTFHLQAAFFSDVMVLHAYPYLFKHLIELFLIVTRVNLLHGDASVVEFDAPISHTSHDGVMSDQHNGTSRAVKVAKEAKNDVLVDGVEVAGGLVGENDLWIVDESACDADTLLLASTEARGQVFGAVTQSDVSERFKGLGFIGHAVEVLREHYILQCSEIGDEMELLEYHSNALSTEAVEVGGAEETEVFAVNENGSGVRAVKASKQIHQCGFARAAGAHDREPFTLFHVQINPIESADDTSALFMSGVRLDDFA